MRIALDTNRYADLAKGVVEVVNTLEHADAIYMPFVTIMNCVPDLHAAPGAPRTTATCVNFCPDQM